MKVLIVEDDAGVRLRYREACPAGTEVLEADNLDMAIKLFLEHEATTDVIIVDGCVPGDEINTLPFIRSARRRGYGGTMIAASSSSLYREQMVAAGCDGQSDKRSLPTLLPALLAA